MGITTGDDVSAAISGDAATMREVVPGTGPLAGVALRGLAALGGITTGDSIACGLVAAAACTDGEASALTTTAALWSSSSTSTSIALLSGCSSTAAGSSATTGAATGDAKPRVGEGDAAAAAAGDVSAANAGTSNVKSIDAALVTSGAMKTASAAGEGD
jgi:hypothetical protein